MASEAQIKEKKWKEYTDKLSKVGMSPPDNISRQYNIQRQYWNTYDPSGAKELAEILK